MDRFRFKRRCFLGVAALAVALALPLQIQSASAAKNLDELTIGPAVGAPLPHPLDVPDQNGKAQSFEALKSERGLVLLFSRSFHW